MRERLAVVVAAAAMASPSLQAADRTVAVTFDDLPGPAAALVSNDVSSLRENT